MDKKLDLKITIKITDGKYIQIGETVIMFEKPVVFVGCLNAMLAFAVKKPRTIKDIQINLYSVGNLKVLDKSGALKIFDY